MEDGAFWLWLLFIGAMLCQPLLEALSVLVLLRAPFYFAFRPVARRRALLEGLGLIGFGIVASVLEVLAPRIGGGESQLGLGLLPMGTGLLCLQRRQLYSPRGVALLEGWRCALLSSSLALLGLGTLLSVNALMTLPYSLAKLVASVAFASAVFGCLLRLRLRSVNALVAEYGERNGKGSLLGAGDGG